jgi:glycosyltransferase involved in cell wall biosynthesis
VIHLVTWLPLPYQRALCRTLDEAYGSDFVCWFAERTHAEFPYRCDVPEAFVHHYLSDVGYAKFFTALRADPDAVVVLCGWSSPMTNWTLLLTTALRIPVLIWADHPHPRDRSMLASLGRKTFLYLLAFRVSGFLASGTPTVEHLVSLGIPRSKITNFPYWVEIPNEWSVPKRCLDRAAGRRPLRLLAIGRHVPVKQFEVAIEAVALANKKAGASVAELVLAGDGPERGRLEALSGSVANLATVSFTGWLEASEIREQIMEADALVITSQFEPYGVVVLEAMACGRPVLASEGVVAARDRNDGTGAVRLHPIGDIECLASQIVSLASDRELLETAARAARATAEGWPLSRAVAIINRMLVKTKTGRILLQRTSLAEAEPGMARQQIHAIEKTSIATGGR